MKSVFIIYRFDPESDARAHYQQYEIEVQPTDKILDCLNRIRWELDPSLAYRSSCAHGICGSDAMLINGRVALACQKLIQDFKTGNNFVVEPLPLFKVIKDLVVDLDPFFEKYRSIRPFLINDSEPPERERLQDGKIQRFFDPALRCILCASCTAACPINRANENYLGPAALLRAFRYVFDSRDTATDERLERLNDENGAWGCRTMWWCTEVCPKEIPVTKCIGQLKRRIKEKDKRAK